ncbi:hypothetical protein F240042I4_19410 [Eisenbergiella tayi]
MTQLSITDNHVVFSFIPLMKQDVSLERSANRYTVSVHYFIKKEIAFPIIFCYSIKQNLKARIYL